ncbi:MAG: hypothetical protein Q7R72_01690 [bacterium]|nr:hypothetical protein [bacterium]
MITYEEFAKIEIKVGKILSAEKIVDTDKLLKLSVDFGMVSIVDIANMTQTKSDVRQIISGISLYFPDPQILVGRKCMFVTNLEPRTIRGLESNGMLFALSTADGKFSLLEPNPDIPEGTKAR